MFSRCFLTWKINFWLQQARLSASWRCSHITVVSPESFKGKRWREVLWSNWWIVWKKLTYAGTAPDCSIWLDTHIYRPCLSLSLSLTHTHAHTHTLGNPPALLWCTLAACPAACLEQSQSSDSVLFSLWTFLTHTHKHAQAFNLFFSPLSPRL